MKKLLLSILFGCYLLSPRAAHIVGGEIEFIYLSDGIYRINLIQYFDEDQTINPGPDANVEVYIFRNSDSLVISRHVLPLISEEPVEYSNPECAIARLQTLKAVWSAEIALDPAEFDDPQGYYIVYERCCRNDGIRNIVNPDGSGMKYVLEIPPLMINGNVFVNSSPILFSPLSDYACVNQFYYVDFSGTDPDGDSLAYSMTTPLNSSSAVALPTPSAKPHINVLYSSGFSESNVVPGNPPLRISNDGLLTITPSDTGLYVFSVLVEEFRNRVKIGETRREFQMLVIDGCEPPDPPVVDVDIPGNPTFNPETDVLTYTVGERKCFNFQVSNVTPGEEITLRAEGVNFDGDLDEIFQLNQIPVGVGESELLVEVCIPDCPPIRDAPFIVDLIAADNACPLPQLDTLRMMIQVQPPPNDFPVPSITDQTIVGQENVPFMPIPVSATDADTDSMTMKLVIAGLEDPGVYGFGLTVNTSVPGSIQADFTWNTDCLVSDFSELQNFKVGILIEDIDTCLVPNPDTLFFDAQIILPPNENPEVSSSISIPDEIELGNLLSFDVTVSDSDGDDVSLQLVGGNFDLPTYGITFPDASGNTTASSPFSWDLACSAQLYEDGQEFELWFIGDDADKCKVKNFDTLKSVIQVNYPPNLQPEFDPVDRIQTLRVNEVARVPIEAFDIDRDEITLSFAQGVRQPSQDIIFEPATGIGRVRSVLEWQPDCSLLRFGETRTLQDVVLQVVDDACPIRSIDTLKITFEIIDDSELQKTFLPPNVFTPNGDGVNDVFTLSGNADLNQNLPADNCGNVFEYIVINNRAGNTVFRSSSRDFVWSGGQFPSGVYYYLVKFTNSEFKGYIHLLK